MSLHSQGLQLLKSNCIHNSTSSNTTNTTSLTNDSYIDLTNANNNSNELQTIDLNSTLEIKIDLNSPNTPLSVVSSTSNLTSSTTTTTNHNNNKLSVDSGVGTVVNGTDNRKSSNSNSGATLIQVNPLIQTNTNTTRSAMNSVRSNNNNNIDYSYYDVYDLDENEPDEDDIFANKVRIDIVNTHHTTTNNATNNAGYCVDSVEPKCNELKRLIDEFKLKFASKIKLINDNKLLTEKLNIVSLSLFLLIF